MIVDKIQLIALHTDELAAWDKLLAGLTRAQRTEPSLPEGLSVKDTLAHLAAWQLRTIARLEGALEGHPPRFPVWQVEPEEPETRESVDRVNAWILASNRNRSWEEVHANWHKGYERFLELVRALPEEDLQSGGQLEWLTVYEPLIGYPGFYDFHHDEHRATLEEWFYKPIS